MFLLLVLVFIILNIILAKVDAKKIANNAWIDHKANAVLYAVCIILTIPFAALVGELNLIFYAFLVPVLLLVRKITFDISLNVFRGKPWDWISFSTTSKIDQFENKIFKNDGTFKYISYSVLLLSIIKIFLVIYES